ncbi:hypothetical protein HAX54_023928, partial [Datura stramonium]|nr:hypothetical protein [Datura stramonium]
ADDSSHGTDISREAVEQNTTPPNSIPTHDEVVAPMPSKPAPEEAEVLAPMPPTIELAETDTLGSSTSKSISDHVTDSENSSESSDVHVIEDLVSNDGQEMNTQARGNQELHEPSMISAYNPQGIPLEVDLSNWFGLKANTNVTSGIKDHTILSWLR